jgi:predicted dehydrogenase
VVDAALAHDLDILTEKPIADTLEASARIVSKVQAAGVKCGVTMTHRFRPDLTTLRQHLAEVGDLDRLVARLLCDYQAYGDWGAEFRHEMDNPLLVDGAIHHLDYLADLAGAPCEQVYAETWTPDWAPFADDAHATVTMRFENGVRATYEGALADATAMNSWGDEYVRAAGEDGTLIADQGAVRSLRPDTEHDGEPVPTVERDSFGGQWLLEQFCDWLDGGGPMPTNVRDSLHSMAIVEAAIRSGDTGEPVDPRALVAETEPTIGG